MLASCHHHDIKLGVVRQSSQLMNCTKIFGNSVKKLQEENEILIQTGIFYGAKEDEDKEAAIVKIGGAERVLYLTRLSVISGEKSEVYEGDGYWLSIKYVEQKKGEATYYVGRCRVRKGLIISEYEIEGIPNIHDY